MSDAVIVSTPLTPIGRDIRGALKNIESPRLAAHPIRHAVERAIVDPGEIGDVVLEVVLAAGTGGMNGSGMPRLPRTCRSQWPRKPWTGSTRPG